MIKKQFICFVSIASLLFVVACFPVTSFRHGRSYVGQTKDDLLSEFGPPTLTQPRTDGGETWIYKSYFSSKSTQVTYYIISKNGRVIKADISYE